MGTVGIGLVNSLDSLLQRFPALLDLAAGRSRKASGQASPAALAAIIETQIIPRLMVAHMPIEALGAPEKVAGPPEGVPCAADVSAFADAVLAKETSELFEALERRIAAGASAETLLIHLLAPAARHLGEWWEQDRCDFVDVTLGLWRLQELTHELAGLMRPVVSMARPRRAVFAMMPGDQHRLGLQMVVEFFRNSGWEAHALDEVCGEPLLDLVEGAGFDLVGLSINQDSQVEALVPLVDSLRARSANPGLLVMVGGAILRERPELAFLIGADATAADAPTAVVRAEAILRARDLTGAAPG
jgi:methanogenic corrinoid protein MtbC1